MNKPEKPRKSLFRRKIDDQNYEHDAGLNRDLDSFGLKLIKAVGLVGVILGLAILIAFWVWVIRWLYKVW
ncbi:MAG: hypothetical protein ACK45H_10910 [Bacteroidota bacterium]|jgi:hypothetical protein